MTNLTDKAELLFRQIHPNFLENGEPSSDRFRPSAKDKNKLSLDRSSLTTPEKSHALYTSNGLQSAAVFGLSVEEFESETISCHSDPVDETETSAANPAHALADYGLHTEQKQKLIAKKLKRLAISRGCLYPPQD